MRPIAALLLVLFCSACAEPPADADLADGSTEPSATEPAPTPGGPADTSSSDPAGEAPDDSATDADRPGSETDLATIPAAFHGEWNADPSACGTATETRLRIEADRIRFYESTGEVQAVSVESDRAITVTAEYTGEGDTWEEDRRLTLSADEAELTVSGGGDLVRTRCP